MIDLHCHLLPGVDDGSKTVAHSLAVLARMASEGVTDVVLTPHLEASRVLEGPPPEHDEAMAALVAEVPPGIKLHRGAEIMLDRALTPRTVSTRRVTLAGSRFVLVEFTRQVAGRSAAAALEHVVQAGLVPLVAHPERYLGCSLAMVRNWKGIGALLQVDANTLFAATSRGNRARDLLAHGLADVLAADNHGDARSLLLPWTRLVDSGFEAEARLLMKLNPAAILADGLPEAVPPATMKVSLLTRLKGWVQEVQE